MGQTCLVGAFQQPGTEMRRHLQRGIYDLAGEIVEGGRIKIRRLPLPNSPRVFARRVRPSRRLWDEKLRKLVGYRRMREVRREQAAVKAMAKDLAVQNFENEGGHVILPNAK